MEALVGWGTVALAIGTFILAGVSTWQALLSRKSMQQQMLIMERDFRFETVRQTLASAPMVVLEMGESNSLRVPGGPTIQVPRRLVLANRGTGPALSVRMSFLVNGKTVTAAQTAVPPLAQNGTFETSIQVQDDGQQPFHVDEMIIRYDDAFGNVYASEYEHFWKSGGWMVWKRPWIGKEFGFPRPDECSEDDPPWGSTGRERFEWHGEWRK